MKLCPKHNWEISQFKVNNDTAEAIQRVLRLHLTIISIKLVTLSAVIPFPNGKQIQLLR